MDYTKMYAYIPNVSMSVFLIKLLYKRQNKNVLINDKKNNFIFSEWNVISSNKQHLKLRIISFFFLKYSIAQYIKWDLENQFSVAKF